VVSRLLSFFPVLPSTSTFPEFITSSKLSSILLCRSLCRTLSAHGTRRPALLRPQNLSCTCDGVSPESCVSLGAISYEASSSWDMYVGWSEDELGKRLSPPRLYTQIIDSHLLCKIFQQPILKPLIAHLQQPLPSIIINVLFLLAHLMMAHSSSSGRTPPTLSPLSEPLLFALVPLRYLSTTPTLNNHKRSGARPTLLCSLARRTE